jgi:hypothetical protein
MADSSLFRPSFTEKHRPQTWADVVKPCLTGCRRGRGLAQFPPNCAMRFLQEETGNSGKTGERLGRNNSETSMEQREQDERDRAI